MSNFLKLSLKAAEESAIIIKDYFKKIDFVYQKNKNYRDLVSEVDNLSEQKILETLKTKFKNHLGKRINIKMSNMDMKIAINMKNNLPEKSDGFFINVKDLSNWTLPSFTKKILNTIK